MTDPEHKDTTMTTTIREMQAAAAARMTARREANFEALKARRTRPATAPGETFEFAVAAPKARRRAGAISFAVAELAEAEAEVCGRLAAILDRLGA